MASNASGAGPGTGIDGGTTRDTGWFGHPRQLARLFTTEMWERFGYYGMRALLTLFLAQHFLFGDATVGGIYGAFTSLVYLTPLFGGLIADRIMGSKRSVKLGALMMALGYGLLCFHGPAAKPTFTAGGQTYAMDSVKSGETSKQFVLVPRADGATGRYQVQGNDDGSITLLGNDGAVLPQTLAKGSFQSEGARDPFYVSVMLLALSLVIVGNGFFKPNISTIVGSLYDKTDTRRDSGFTIFYMGINLGSIISQFFCPLLAIWYGFEAGFALAAIGMFIAWGLFQFDGGRLAGFGEPPAGTSRQTALWVTVGAILAVPVAWFFLNNTVETAAAAAAAAKAGTGVIGYLISLPILGKVLFAIFLTAVIGIPIWAWRTGTRQEFQMMVVATVLIVFTVVFWTLFEQAGSSLTLFAERNTDRQIGGYLMPAGQAQIFNPLFVVMLAPLFSLLWVWLEKRGLNPSTPFKFVIGLVFVGLGFLALVWGSRFADPATFQVPLFWLATLYLLQTIGELCLSPVGLSMVTKLSIARVVGLMMGVFFLASAMAQYVGGIIAQGASVETVGGAVTNPRLALETYLGVFETLGWGALAAAAVLAVLALLFLNRWMHGVK